MGSSGQVNTGVTQAQFNALQAQVNGLADYVNEALYPSPLPSDYLAIGAFDFNTGTGWITTSKDDGTDQQVLLGPVAFPYPALSINFGRSRVGASYGSPQNFVQLAATAPIIMGQNALGGEGYWAWPTLSAFSDQRVVYVKADLTSVDIATRSGSSFTVQTLQPQLVNESYLGPVFSRSGSKVAFIVADSFASTNKIRVVDAADGSLISESTDIQAALGANRLVWDSTDSYVYLQALNFNTYPDTDFVQVDAATGTVSVVANVPGTNGILAEAWDLTPDDATIAFIRRDAVTATEFAIWTTPTSGGALTQRSTNIDYHGNIPVISTSPDSSFAAASYSDGSETGGQENAIAIVDLTAGAPAAPTATFALPVGAQATNSIQSVAWRETP